MDWFLENFTKCDTPRGTLGSGPVLGRYARLDELTSGELARGTDSPLRVFEPLAPLPYTNLTILEYLRSVFGGRIGSIGHRRMHWKIGYQWDIRWDAAVSFIEAIEPWLRIKKEQALVAIAWGEIRNRRNQPGDDKECVALLVEQLRWLNKKGADGQQGVDPMTAVLQKSWAMLLPEVYLKEWEARDASH